MDQWQLIKAWNRTGDRPEVKIAQEGGAIIVNSIKAAISETEIIFTSVDDVPKKLTPA